MHAGDVLDSSSTRVDSPCGSILVTVAQGAGGTPERVSCSAGRQGSCIQTALTIGCELVTIGLGAGVSTDDLVGILKGHNCPRAGFVKGVGDMITCHGSLAAGIETLCNGKGT